MESIELQSVKSRVRVKQKKVLKKKKKVIAKYPEKGYTLDMCLAKKRSEANAYCKNKALKNGRCRFHKGSNRNLPTNIKTGMYSKYLPEIFKHRHLEFKNDPEILELKEEIALLRVINVRIHELIEGLRSARIELQQGGSPVQIKEEIEYLEKAADNIEKIARTVEKARKVGEGMLPIESLQLCMTQIAYFANFSISFCPACQQDLSSVKQEFFERLKEIRVPAREES